MKCVNISIEPPTSLVYFYNINSIISFISNSFGAYMLYFHTPKEMKQYKYVLMNITFWAYFVDFVGSLLMGPVNMLPLPGGFAVGSLRWLLPSNVYFLILLILIGTTGCATSIVFGFMYRWWILCFGHWVHEEPWRLPALAMMPFVMFLFPIAFCQYQMWPKEAETIAYLTENCPMALPVIQMGYYMFIEETKLQNLMNVFNVAGVCNCSCMVYSLFRIFHKLNPRNMGTMSEKTVRMNRQLIWSLILHTSIPGMSYIVPTLITMTIMQLQVPNVQKFLHFMGAMFLTHSTWSVLTMLVTIGAYRKKIFEWLHITKEKVEQQHSTATLRSVTIL